MFFFFFLRLLFPISKLKGRANRIKIYIYICFIYLRDIGIKKIFFLFVIKNFNTISVPLNSFIQKIFYLKNLLYKIIIIMFFNERYASLKIIKKSQSAINSRESFERKGK